MAITLAGCFGDVETVFPDGLEPLEATRALPFDEGSCPEGPNLAQGEREAHAWVHLRGCLPGTLSEVWSVLRTPEVTVDRRAVDTWSVTLDTDPTYAFSYTVANEVKRVITVNYELAWRQDVVTGSLDAPEVVAARWQKVRGSEVISLLEGSFVAKPRGDDAVELEVVYRQDGAFRDKDAILAYVRDFFASALAVTRGEPLPDWGD